MKLNLTGNEPLHFLFLKSISCRVHLCGCMFKISDQLDEKWLRYSWLKSVSFWWLTELMNELITLAGSRGSFDPKKMGNEIEFNRKWMIILPVFEFISYNYKGIFSKLQTIRIKNGLDIVDSNIFFIFCFEKYGNELTGNE